MLGDRAKVVVIPTLEITADNVVCSHGAAIADLDENAMFYLASRGIDRNVRYLYFFKCSSSLIYSLDSEKIFIEEFCI